MADLLAVYERDPATHRLMQPILFFKGFQALQAYRIGHWLWQQGRSDMAYFVQMRCSEVFGVDIHPAARIGTGVMIGAGAKVLGNIRVGHHSRIAAGSVVLSDVPCCKTVAGVPARIVGDAGCTDPSNTMNQLLGHEGLF